MFALIIIRISEGAEAQRGAVSSSPGPHSPRREELGRALCSTPGPVIQKRLKWKLCHSPQVPGLGCPLCSEEARPPVQCRITPGHPQLCTHPAHKGRWGRGQRQLSSEAWRAGLSLPLSLLRPSESLFPHLKRGMLLFFCLMLWALSEVEAGKWFFTLLCCAHIIILKMGNW